MDKQKQIDKDINVRSKMIEEMAKAVQRDMCGDRPCEECNYHGFKTKILPRYCEVYLIAEKLYNAGYRKIPDAVVILEEGIERFAETFAKSPQMQKVMNGLIKAWQKETAEKFAERLKELVADRNCNEDYDWEEVQVDGQIFVECVDEICKEITDGKA